MGQLIVAGGYSYVDDVSVIGLPNAAGSIRTFPQISRKTYLNPKIVILVKAKECLTDAVEAALDLPLDILGNRG